MKTVFMVRDYQTSSQTGTVQYRSSPDQDVQWWAKWIYLPDLSWSWHFLVSPLVKYFLKVLWGQHTEASCEAHQTSAPTHPAQLQHFKRPRKADTLSNVLPWLVQLAPVQSVGEVMLDLRLVIVLFLHFIWNRTVRWNQHNHHFNHVKMYLSSAVTFLAEVTLNHHGDFRCDCSAGADVDVIFWLQTVQMEDDVCLRVNYSV